MYQALYRKWRPLTFDDVVGQEPITTTLKNQISGNKLSHAYLFCGSHGTGKTTCSKILAKAVNCLSPNGGNPCGKCTNCIGIDNGSILDVTEIDAASNSGVDNIRELREEANFTPVSTKYRVYIIDETHMLSTGAFNALLKIMEEPPPHVLFILATTEIHKVPATILSRCQRFDFQRIPSKIMADHMLQIAEVERIQLQPEAAQLIARLSNGAVRDSLSLLDLCITSGEEITVELVEARSGLASQEYLSQIALAAIDENSTGILEIAHNLWKHSIDYQRFCGQLLDYYRNLLVILSVKDPTNLVDATPREIEGMKEVAKGYSLARIFYCITTLSDTLNRMYRTSMRKTEMEMGLLKLCTPSMDTSKEALLLRIEKLETTPRTIVAQTIPTPKIELTPEEVTKETHPVPSISKEELLQIKVQPFEPWFDIVTILKTKNKALYGTLVDSKAYTTKDLLLVDAGPFFTDMVRTDEYARQSLRDAAEVVTGQIYRLGPYNAEEYAVAEEKNSLDDLEEMAKNLGISIEIKE